MVITYFIRCLTMPTFTTAVISSIHLDSSISFSTVVICLTTCVLLQLSPIAAGVSSDMSTVASPAVPQSTLLYNESNSRNNSASKTSPKPAITTASTASPADGGNNAPAANPPSNKTNLVVGMAMGFGFTLGLIIGACILWRCVCRAMRDRGDHSGGKNRIGPSPEEEQPEGATQKPVEINVDQIARRSPQQRARWSREQNDEQPAEEEWHPGARPAAESLSRDQLGASSGDTRVGARSQQRVEIS